MTSVMDMLRRPSDVQEEMSTKQLPQRSEAQD